MITPEENNSQEKDTSVEPSTTPSKDHNSHGDHMLIDEEGNEVGPEDE